MSISQSPSNQIICPVTGLQIVRKKDWVFSSPDKNFTSSLAWVNGNILLAQPTGNLGLNEARNLISLVQRLLRERKGEQQDLVHIIDYSGVTNYSVEARRYFTEQNKKNFQFKAMIFCNASSFQKLSIKLAKRIHSLGKNLYLVEDYNNAIILALEILALANPNQVQPLASLRTQPSWTGHPDEEILVRVDYSILTNPHWCGHIALEKSYVTFSQIGGNILTTRLLGDFGQDEFHALEAKKRSILAQDSFKGPLYEILDASCLSFRSLYQIWNYGIPAKELLHATHLVAPNLVKRLFFMGLQTLGRTKQKLEITNNFDRALQPILTRLGRLRNSMQGKITPCHREESWTIELDGFSLCYEVIGNNIIHSQTEGFLKEEHIDPVFNLQEKVLKEAGLENQSYYFIGGVAGLSDLGGTRGARAAYKERTLQFYQKYPFEFYIFYGVDPLLGAAINMVKPLISFPIGIADDLGDSLRIIISHRLERSYRQQTASGWDRQSEHEAKEPADAILSFLGQIDWESYSEQAFPDVPQGHELQKIFEAIKLIKLDLDDVYLERAEITKELKKSENSLNRAQKIAQLASFEWSLPEGMHNCSKNYSDLLGLEPLGKSPQLSDFFDQVDLTQRVELEPKLMQVMTEMLTFQTDIKILCPDGTQRVLHFIGQPETDGVRYIVSLQDVTSTFLLEQNLHISNARTDRAISAKTRFLQNVSHELRTPLNAILGFSDLLSMTELDETQEDYLEPVSTSSRHLLELINDLLEYIDLQTSMPLSGKEEFSIEFLLSELVAQCGAAANKKGLKLDYQIRDVLPEKIKGFRHYISQVLLHFINNAIKFTKEGRVEVFVERELISEGLNIIQFGVLDTGCGLDEQSLAYLMEPFTMADDSMTRAEPGLGMGLALSSLMAQLLGGEIKVESKLGQGATFSLFLPCIFEEF